MPIELNTHLIHLCLFSRLSFHHCSNFLKIFHLYQFTLLHCKMFNWDWFTYYWIKSSCHNIDIEIKRQRTMHFCSTPSSFLIPSGTSPRRFSALVLVLFLFLFPEGIMTRYWYDQRWRCEISPQNLIGCIRTKSRFRLAGKVFRRWNSIVNQ